LHGDAVGEQFIFLLKYLIPLAILEIYEFANFSIRSEARWFERCTGDPSPGYRIYDSKAARI
jgi:hypothetical protein